ncbi:MAG: patatin-like phospholipase family protein [Betaproteobacteria bacterium]|nr:patatin-like phospholipase family protein [Betaproteobacteria bacterium]
MKWLFLLLFLAGCATRPAAPPGPSTPVATQDSRPGSVIGSPPRTAGVATEVPVTAEPASPGPAAAARRPPRLCLALGGGAARGFAHIGVIQVLEESGIKPHCVAGTSAGSLVAALYASGLNGTELAKLALRMDESAITDWSFPGRGVIRGEALARYVRQQTQGKLIEQLPMPLGIVATDLDSGQGVLFRRGDLGQAVRASSAVPAVFQPVRIANREYVDGGLVSPVPVRYAREMGAEMVVAVDISTQPDGQPTSDPFSLLLQTFSIMGRSINQFELREADVVVRPALAGVSSADFTARQKAIQAGRQAALLQLASIRERVKALAQPL